MLASIIRTVVPVIVGFLLGLPIAGRLGVTPGDLTAVVTAIVTGVYYIAARVLETYVPAFGWLLGLPTAPTYTEGGSVQ